MTNGSRLTSITQSGRGLMATKRVTVDLLGQRVELVPADPANAAGSPRPSIAGVRVGGLDTMATATPSSAPQRRWPSLLVKRPGGRIEPGRIFLLHAVLAAGAGGQPAKASQSHITTPAQDQMTDPAEPGESVGGVLHPCDRGPPTRHVAGQRLGSGRSTASTAASTIALLAACPRLGAIAWAASPTSTNRPSAQRRQSIRTT